MNSRTPWNADPGRIAHPSRWALGALILLGFGALAHYLSWWFGGVRVFVGWLTLGLCLAAFYNLSQLVLAWFLYWKANPRGDAPTPATARTIDVMIPIYNEPFPVIERALRAAMAVRGASQVWLLDDANDVRAKALAESLGARYRRREVRRDAKAGNVNEALQESSAELVAIFDVDHAPLPEFLERTVGYFDDPKIGFVQVMLTFANENESWIARASGESALDFYNPTSIGMDSIGCATLVGSNAVIRRGALDSIAGYRPGLAEDLATSVALHAAQWRSVYVAEPLAPGLAPSDLEAWFSQQLKWSRGVFEVMIADYFRVFGKLTGGQRTSYMVRGTYYLIGLVVFIHALFTTVYLLGGDAVAHVDFVDYLSRFIPLAVVALLVRQAAMRSLRHPSVSMRLLWRPFVLVTATWPIYVLGFVLALLRVPLDYRPTPKARGAGLSLLWLLPQTAMIAAQLVAIAMHVASAPLLLVAFAVFQVVLQASVLLIAVYERGRVWL